MRKKMLFLILTTTLSMTGLNAQNLMQGDVSKDLQQTAKEEVEMWSMKLALSAKQRNLMEDKIVEFSIKKQKLLQMKMAQEKKEEKLIELQILENRDMRDILTGPQYRLYISELRKQILQSETGPKGK